ncbi:MAG: TraV family lipoprotein, partial [Thiohalocapsa sp.]
MSKRPFSLAGVSSTALVLMLTGCAASLPNSQSSAPPTTAPDTVAALQGHQPEVVSQAQQADASEPTIAAAPTPADVVESAAAKVTAKAPEPTRTPASVLRLWVAPWEDADGNLHGAS